MSSESSRPVVGMLPSGGRKYGWWPVGSAGPSNGRTAGWSRMVVNHGTVPTARSSVVQAVRPTQGKATRNRRRRGDDALNIPYLFSTRCLEDGFRPGCLCGAAEHQHAELVVAEA